MDFERRTLSKLGSTNPLLALSAFGCDNLKRVVFRSAIDLGAVNKAETLEINAILLGSSFPRP